MCVWVSGLFAYFIYKLKRSSKFGHFYNLYPPKYIHAHTLWTESFFLKFWESKTHVLLMILLFLLLYNIECYDCVFQMADNTRSTSKFQPFECVGDKTEIIISIFPFCYWVHWDLSFKTWISRYFLRNNLKFRILGDDSMKCGIIAFKLILNETN